LKTKNIDKEDVDNDNPIIQNQIIQNAILDNDTGNVSNNVNILNLFKRKIKTNGKYNIDGKIYDKLSGSRKEVIDGKAYQTTGSLLKDDLLVNKYGTIVSKKKFISEKNNNRFELYNKSE
jgi:hypothetical protein